MKQTTLRKWEKSCLRTEAECLEREVTSQADGLFKLSINVSLKKDLNYIDEFKSRADGGKLSPS